MTRTADSARGWTQITFNRLALSGLVLGFLALGAVVGLAAWTVGQYKTYGGLVSHTHLVVREISDLGVASERAETARRGYLLKADKRFEDAFRDATTELPRRIGRLQTLTADNPRQQARLARVSALNTSRIQMMERSITLVQNGQRAQALAEFEQDGSAEAVFELRTLTRAMVEEETRLLEARADRQQAIGTRLVAALIGAAVLLTIVAVTAVSIVSRIMTQLTRSHAELAKLNAGLEAAVRERTSDLQRANDEIQRFAYIVSHDLRSPLVNVLGFTSELSASLPPLRELLERAEAEAPALVTNEARTAVREDLPEAIGFIRGSTQKMDRLINAILKLSREGQRIVSPEPLNMSALLGGVTDSVRHRLNEKQAEIRVEGAVPDVVSDRLAIEQVFGNLVDNAVKYLSPERSGRIVLRGWQERGRVVYEVEDNGRGVAAKDHERIFELFRRAGTQDQPGEGLGLAHVRALVYRLGGTITCSSELGRGATFRISLPSTAGLEGPTT